jgi:HAE1 family hydrophobic/amphiphilic exporter-1
MALAVIGGVFFSTLLTLFVVPCAYSLLARVESRHHEEAMRDVAQRLG